MRRTAGRYRQRIAAALLLSAVLYGLIWGAMHSQASRLVIGDYGDWEWLTGFYRPERLPADRYFRWTSEDAVLRLPAPGDYGTRRFSLKLDGLRPPGSAAPTVRVALDGQAFAFVAPLGSRRYEFLSRPAHAHAPLAARIQSDTWSPEGRSDNLGVIVEQAASYPLAPTLGWALLGWSVALVAALALAAGALGRSAWPVAVAVGGVVLPLLLAHKRHLAGGGLQVAVGLTLVIAMWWYWMRRRVPLHRVRAIALLSLIVLVGAVLRAYNLNWDDGAGFHVDEAVLNRASLALRPPYNPHFFAYGSLPIYLYRVTAALLGIYDSAWLDPRIFPLVGRGYAVLSSTLTIALVALLGTRLGGRHLGLVGALYFAFTVLAIQAAHFGTTDSLLTLLGIALAYTSLNLYDNNRRRDFIMAGSLIGFGVAIKITALVFGPLPLLAIVVREMSEGRVTWSRLRALAGKLGLALLASIIACLLGAPYYLLDAASWLQAMRVEWSDATSGMADYTRQFIGTTPYLFLIQNFPWTLGWPLTVASLVGVGVVGVETVRRWPTVTSRRWMIILGWVSIYFIFFGRVHDKYIRYTLPLTPILALCAAQATLTIGRWFRGSFGQALAICVVGGGTGLYALAFVNGVYGVPDSRLLASHWLELNTTSGTIITREQYDVRLPIRISSDQSLGGLPWYPVESLQWYSVDTPAKARTIAQQLGEATHMIIASSTSYRPSLAHPELFPMNARFYQLVLGGASELREVARWQPGPRLGSWRSSRPAPDDTFEIFDHPTVMIYERTPEFDVDQFERYLWPETAE